MKSRHSNSLFVFVQHLVWSIPSWEVKITKPPFHDLLDALPATTC